MAFKIFILAFQISTDPSQWVPCTKSGHIAIHSNGMEVGDPLMAETEEEIRKLSEVNLGYGWQIVEVEI